MADGYSTASLAQAAIERIRIAAGNRPVLPPIATSVELKAIDDPQALDRTPEKAKVLQPISGFTCVIDYEGEARLITCRRYDLIGERAYVGAICHSARGYRQFRCDRIWAVIEAETGEVLGVGDYFQRFEVKSRRDATPSWGISSSQRTVLIAGLNALAFLARCDGQWHALEDEPIERFVCAMWLRKEWAGDPPIDEIMAHARRLAPDASLALKGLKHFARSESSLRILLAAFSGLIDADGVITPEEVRWVAEMQDRIADAEEDDFQNSIGSFHTVLEENDRFQSKTS